MILRFARSLALCVAAWIAVAATAGSAFGAAPAWPKAAGVAADPAVRFGVLPNGLRYAIMHNETPKGQVAMRLQIEAGSIQEGPGQEGLAHFIEHMAFRGTTHVADGEMVSSLQRLGLAFGADTNATTSQTATTYMFNLPRSDDASTERGLFLLREIASELTLDPAVARTESGVILSEERSRAGEDLSAATAQIAQVYGAHPFARLPIGRTEVITKADVKQMGAFYDAYYRPEKAVLVVVGDVDADAIEARIKTGFSNWAGKGPAGVDPAPLAPSGGGPRFVAVDGKPLISQMSLTWIKPYQLPGDSEAQRLDRNIRAVAQTAFARRMARVAEAAGNPFAGASLSESTQPGVSTTATLSAALINDWRAALDLLVKSKTQLVAYGFTQDEIDQVLTQARASSRASIDRAATRSTSGLADALLDSAVGGHVFRAPADAAADFEHFAPQITLERVNARAAELFAGEGPLVWVSAPGAPQTDPGLLRTTYVAADAAPAQRLVQAAVRPWPYSDFGAPGAVVERSEIAGLGIVQVRFANGVRLTFKQNTTIRDQILVQVRFGRGLRDVPADRPALSTAAGLVVNSGGLAEYSPTELAKALTGKQASVQFGVSEGEFTASGVTRPVDLATELQLMAARITRPGWRPELYATARDATGAIFGAFGSSPALAYAAQSDLLLHGGDLRWQIPGAATLSALSADDGRAVIEPAMAKAPLEVLIVGDTTIEAAIAEVARTFGALPARTGRPDAAGPVKVSFPAPAATPVVITHTGRPDQALAAIAWPTTDSMAGPKDGMVAQVLTNVMRSRLTEQLRAHDGKTYTPAASSTFSPFFEGYGRIQMQAEVAPADVNVFYVTAEKIAADLAATPISDDELARALAPMVEANGRDRQSNAYWMSWMGRLSSSPWVADHLRSMPAGLTSITAAEVQDSATKWLVPARAWKAKAVAASAN